MTYDQPNLDTVANKQNVFLVAVCTRIWLCRMDWMGETRYSMDLSHTKGPSIRRASAGIHHVIWLNYNNSLTITNLKIVVTLPLAVIPLAIIPVTSRRQIIVPSFAGHSSISMFISIWDLNMSATPLNCCVNLQKPSQINLNPNRLLAKSFYPCCRWFTNDSWPKTKIVR